MSRSRFVALVLVAFADSADAQAPVNDLAGDLLPPGAVARIGTTRYRITGWHQQAFLSPDGKTVIAKGEQSQLKLFEADTGKLIDEVKDPDVRNWVADLSPDGKFLAVVGSTDYNKPPVRSILRLYDLGTRKPVWTSFPEYAERAEVRHVRFTPDGKRIVTAGPDVRVWDAKTGSELFRHKVPIGYGDFDISRDGKSLVTAGRGIQIWNLEPGAIPRTLEVELRSSVQGVRFSPDGKLVHVIGLASSIKTIDLATGRTIGRLHAEADASRISYSPDGTRYAVEYFSRYDRPAYVSIRETATGSEVIRLATTGEQAIGGGSWSRDGSRYAATTDSRVWLWDIKTGKVLGNSVSGHEAYIADLAFCSDGRLFTASDDQTIRAWDPKTGKELMRRTMDGRARGLAISQDGSLVACNGLRNDFRVWDSRTGKEVFKLLGHGFIGGVRRVRFLADDQRLVSFGDDYTLRVWDTLSGKLKMEQKIGTETTPGAQDDDDENRRLGYVLATSSLSADGRALILATFKEVRAFDTETGKMRYRLEVDPGGIQQLALSADGKRFAAGGPGARPVGQAIEQPKDVQIGIWDATKAESIVKFRVPGSYMNLLAFTPDGRRVVTGTSENSLSVWDATTGAAIGTIPLPARAANLTFDQTGTRLAIAFFDTTALVYDLASVIKPPTK